MYNNSKENRRFLLDFVQWMARQGNWQQQAVVTLVDNFLNQKEPEAVHGNEAEKEKEIERLKGLINLLWFHDINTGYDDLFDDETKNYWYQKFKEKHNI